MDIAIIAVQGKSHSPWDDYYQNLIDLSKLWTDFEQMGRENRPH